MQQSGTKTLVTSSDALLLGAAGVANIRGNGGLTLEISHSSAYGGIRMDKISTGSLNYNGAAPAADSNISIKPFMKTTVARAQLGTAALADNFAGLFVRGMHIGE